jgi:uncharacterized protein
MFKWLITQAQCGLQIIITGSIKAYRAVISPFLGPNCRFYPSCSHYALQAIERHGVWQGMYLSVRRMLRCHPGSAGGVDPVPAPTKEQQE